MRMDGPYRLLGLNSLPQVCRAAWEALGGMALEELCHQGLALKFRKMHSIPSALSALCCGCDVNSKLLLLEQASLPAATVPATMVMDSKPPEL